MKPRVLVIPALVFCFICGCAKSNKQSIDQNGIHEIPSPSLQEAYTVARNASVACANPDCHDSVGMLSMIFPEKRSLDTGAQVYPVGTCTAFFVAPDVVATNAHCVPGDLRGAGSSCKDRIWLNLPQSGAFGAERIGCATVLSASTTHDDKDDPQYIRLPDFAFLRLEHATGRPALSMTQEGLSNDLPVTVVKVNPASSSEAYGVMTRATCTAVHGSLLIPSFNHPKRPIATLSACGILQGNSGSPVIDANGAVRAIIHGVFSKSGLELALATNTACIPFNGVNSVAVAPECEVTPTSAAGKATKIDVPQEDLRRTLEAVDHLAKTWGDTLDTPFEWTGFAIHHDSELGETLDRVGVGAATQPLSVHGQSMYGNPKTLLFTGARARCFKSRYSNDSDATIEVDSPIWVTKMGVDKAYRIVVGTAATSNRLHIVIRFSPSEFAQTGKSETVLTVKDWLYGTFEIGRGTLETCQ